MADQTCNLYTLGCIRQDRVRTLAREFNLDVRDMSDDAFEVLTKAADKVIDLELTIEEKSYGDDL